MARKTTVGGMAAALAITMLLLGPGRATAADDAAATGDGVVPPSTYVEGIESPGKTGGTDAEADAAAAQAKAAKAAAPATPPQSARSAAIATDLIIGRPTALMATVGGAAFFVLSLPITAPAGMYEEARERFVAEPGKRLIAPIGE